MACPQATGEGWALHVPAPSTRSPAPRCATPAMGAPQSTSRRATRSWRWGYLRPDATSRGEWRRALIGAAETGSNSSITGPTACTSITGLTGPTVAPWCRAGTSTGSRLHRRESSATFSIAPGAATDDGVSLVMALASALNKTTGARTVGTGNGALDTGAIANATGITWADPPSGHRWVDAHQHQRHRADHADQLHPEAAYRRPADQRSARSGPLRCSRTTSPVVFPPTLDINVQPGDFWGVCARWWCPRTSRCKPSSRRLSQMRLRVQGVLFHLRTRATTRQRDHWQPLKQWRRRADHERRTARIAGAAAHLDQHPGQRARASASDANCNLYMSIRAGATSAGETHECAGVRAAQGWPGG